MILINVLPPELRKRDSGFNPLVYIALAGTAVNAALLFLALYVMLGRIPASQNMLEDLNTDLARKQEQVKKVQEDEARIVAFEKRRDLLFDLLGSKVFHARSLNEFLTLLSANAFTAPGFAVSVANLDVSPKASRDAAPARGKKGSTPELKQIQWNWKVRILGENRVLAGDYIKSFFQTLTSDPFWSRNQFVGDPADTYSGDSPKFNEELGKVTVDYTLSWSRVVTPVVFKPIPATQPEKPKPAVPVALGGG